MSKEVNVTGEFCFAKRRDGQRNSRFMDIGRKVVKVILKLVAYCGNGVFVAQHNKSFLVTAVKWIYVKSWKSFKSCMALVTTINKGEESLWKCQNLNDCPDVSGLCPSSVECSLWVAPRFLVLNLNFKSSVLYARANFKWNENQHQGSVAGVSWVERRDAFPASSSGCSHRRVWSRRSVRRQQYVRWNWNALRLEKQAHSCGCFKDVHRNVPSECAQSRRCKWQGNNGRSMSCSIIVGLCFCSWHGIWSTFYYSRWVPSFKRRVKQNAWLSYSTMQLGSQ